MRSRVRAVCLLAAICAAAPARACLWDRDTLEHEGGKMPDVVQTIVGWFDRNPPLFYEMRLARVSSELSAAPGRLDLYDDAAVAADRLGRDDEAIALMARKRAAMERAGLHAQTGDPWYRYYANLGTFHAHRWLRARSSATQHAQDIHDLRSARDEIAAALAINPNAHFGRERYQLWILDWLLDSAAKSDAKEAKPLSEYLDARLRAGEPPIEDQAAYRSWSRSRADAARGLTGLVVLGAAWESPDLFDALATTLRRPETALLDYLALLRARELLRSEARSIGGLTVARMDERLQRVTVAGEVKPVLEQQYRTLRAEADANAHRRDAFMLPRLGAGRHPDTDPTFWQGWRAPGPPSLALPWPTRTMMFLRSPNGMLVALLAALVLIGAASAAFQRRKRRAARRLETQAHA